MKQDSQKIGIVGATGYTGEELLKLLQNHPQVEVVFAADLEAGQPVRKIFPYLHDYQSLKFCSTQDAMQYNVDLVFLCLPHGQSAQWVKTFYNKGCKVVDLGADFRFTDPGDYKKWYGEEHPEPELLKQSVYGLPEWNREKIARSKIVGNPGCYPTSVLLAMLPLVEKGLLKPGPILVDSKSGVSGAGRTPTATTHFININENLIPYKPGHSHRHIGEMEQELSRWAGHPMMVVFTPHLLPVSRGILSSITVRLKDGVIKEDVLDCYDRKYSPFPNVRILRDQLPSLKMVAHTNLNFIGVEMVPDTDILLVFSAIDNLCKGASGQAVQNMNIMLGLQDNLGLP
jgi:N-acetyl-gamma-glutamyl-phosphate reductase